MKIIIKREALEVAQLFRAKNDIRFYLNAILFKSDGRVAATNGHVMMVSQHESPDSLDGDTIISVQKSPVRKYDHAEICTDSGIASFISDEKTVGVSMIEVIDGKFPDIDRITTFTQEATTEIGLNAEYLQLTIKAAKIYSPLFSTIKLELQGSQKAACARVSSANGCAASLFVMPCRL